MEEFYINNGLISKDEWITAINRFRPDSEIDESIVKIRQTVKKLLQDAVKERLEGEDSVAIMFSGGLDSSYIAALCKKYNANFTCYTVGFQDGNFKEPEDIIEAKKVAEYLKLGDRFTYKIFNLKEIEIIMKKTIEILDKNVQGTDLNNVVNIGVGAVVVAAHSISKGEKVFFSGLGSEEIFAGYDRHKKNPSNTECFNGLLNMYERDLLRDSTIAKSLGVDFKTPFLDPKLIEYSLRIPIKLKVDDTGSKLALRKAAHDLLGNYSERPKRAAQYGSSFDRAISKLASLKGLKYKKDYIKNI